MHQAPESSCDAYNDAERALHIIGLDLDPPSGSLASRKRRRKAKEAALEAAEEREIYLACERMGTVYKNKAERIEEAKNNGTYDSPEPSPREEFGSRPPTRSVVRRGPRLRLRGIRFVKT